MSSTMPCSGGRRWRCCGPSFFLSFFLRLIDALLIHLGCLRGRRALGRRWIMCVCIERRKKGAFCLRQRGEKGGGGGIGNASAVCLQRRSVYMDMTI